MHACPATTTGAFVLPKEISNLGVYSIDIDVCRSIVGKLVQRRLRINTESFTTRRQSILQETSIARQRMLADSLMLEISRATHAHRERSKRLSALAEQAAQLATLPGAMCRQLADRADATLAREDAEAAAKLTSEITELIASERKTLAAAAKRRAILTTLTELGYEVRDGMETAWVNDGRLVMRRAANPEMGVEVKGAVGADQLQFRPVRFGAADAKSDRANDRDIEALWCSDFNKLHKRVQAEKGEFKIEKAMSVGAVEVLFVAEREGSETRQIVAAPLKSRSI